MSTVAHKTIYIDVFTGEEQPILSSLKDHHVALTQMESSLASIHTSLRAVKEWEERVCGKNMESGMKKRKAMRKDEKKVVELFE